MRTLIAVLATTLVAGLASAAPRPEARFRIVLDLAREYAAQMPYLWYSVHADLADAIKHLRLFSDDPLQQAELARAVLANVRDFLPTATDAALDAQCKAKDVENAVATFTGVGVPFVLRPPFDKIGR